MLNFPANPANGQQYTNGDRSWKWSSLDQAWGLIPVSTADSIIASNAAIAAAASAAAAEAAAASVGDVAADAAAAQASADAAADSATAAAASANAADTSKNDAAGQRVSAQAAAAAALVSEEAAEASATTASTAATTATTKAGEASADAAAALASKTAAETAETNAETAASAAATSATAADASADAAAASAASLVSATTVGLGGNVLDKGLFDLDDADLGTFIRVYGTQDQGDALHWPYIGPFGVSGQIFLVQTYGEGLAGSGSVVQIATSGIAASATRTFVRNRSEGAWLAWRELVFMDSVYPAQSQIAVNAQVGTAYTLVAADAGKEVNMANGAVNVVTVPPNADVPHPVRTVIFVGQGGVGATSVAAGAGVTLNGELNVGGQHKMISLIKTATNTWTVLGGVA